MSSLFISEVASPGQTQNVDGLQNGIVKVKVLVFNAGNPRRLSICNGWMVYSFPLKPLTGNFTTSIQSRLILLKIVPT